MRSEEPGQAIDPLAVNFSKLGCKHRPLPASACQESSSAKLSDLPQGNKVVCLAGLEQETLLLLPADIHLSLLLSNDTSNSAAAAVIEAPVLAVQVSPEIVAAARALVVAFAGALAESSGKNKGECAEADHDLPQPTVELADDLRCGLFEKAELVATRPGTKIVLVSRVCLPLEVAACALHNKTNYHQQKCGTRFQAWEHSGSFHPSPLVLLQGACS